MTLNKIISLKFLCALASALFFSTSVFAACSSPAGVAGDVIYETNNNIVQYCNGTNWVNTGAKNAGAGSGGCSSPTGTEGEVIFNTTNGVMQFCNGADWVNMACPDEATTGGGGCSSPSGTAGDLIYTTGNKLQFCDSTNWLNTGSLCLSGGGGGGGGNAEALAVIAAMTSAPDGTRQGHITTLVNGLKTDGIWTKLDALWVLAAHDTQAASINWVDPTGTKITAVNSPSFRQNAGYMGNGSSNMYLNTGFNLSTDSTNYTRDSASLGIWHNSNNTATYTYPLIAQTGSSYANLHNTTNGLSYAHSRLNTTSNGFTLTPSSYPHLISVDRDGASSQKGYINGSYSTGNTDSSTPPPNVDITLLDYVGGSKSSNGEISVAFAGGSLTAAEHANLYTRLNSYLTAVLADAPAHGINAYTYASKSFDNSNQSTYGTNNDVKGIAFNSAGTKMFIIMRNARVHEIDLSTAWDISTGSNNSYYTTSEVSNPQDIAFNSDGTKMYALDYSYEKVVEYSLSTGWDVSTASYTRQTTEADNQATGVSDFAFKPDGTKIYIADNGTDRIYQYSLSTAWNVSSMSYDSKQFNHSSQESEIQGLSFNADGTKMYVDGRNSDTVHQYTLSTAWDVSTASYDSVSLNHSAQADYPAGLAFGDSHAKMYISDPNDDKIYQYNAP